MGTGADDGGVGAQLQSINAVTLATADMPRAVAFYGALGLRASYGGAAGRFTVLDVEPEGPPRDAEWGERYFHLRDPDGHELSFAARLPGERRGGGRPRR